MTNKILYKRSSVSGKVPLLSDLDPGEILMNTADGVLYVKKDNDDIVQISKQLTGVRNFVASGAINAGDVVGLKNNGSVEVITGSLIPDGVGTETQFSVDDTSYINTTYDSFNDKIIVAYRDTDQSGSGFVVVGTVSGTSISFGTPVQFSNGTNSITDISATFDTLNNKVIIAYSDTNSSSSGFAIVGTVSGTSISFGTEVKFSSGANDISNISTTYDTLNNKVVIAYQDAANGKSAWAIVGTVSETSISFGTEIQFTPVVDDIYFISATFDTLNNKVIIAYQNATQSGSGFAIVGTVSGTSISFGTEVQFSNGTNSITDISATFDTLNNKTIIAYRDTDQSSSGFAIVGTVLGTSISFGTPVQFSNGTNSVAYISTTFNIDTNEIFISYVDIDQSNSGMMIRGIVSGTSISFSNEINFNSDITANTSIVYDVANPNIVICYADNGNQSIGTGVVFVPIHDSSNIDLTIGLAAESIADTNTGKINIISGINNQQSGLIPGTKYYVDYSGSITPTPNNLYSSKLLGRALSSTEILLESLR